MNANEPPLLTFSALAEAERELVVPFVVDVATSQGEQRLLVTELLRLLPGRRLAARARPLAADALSTQQDVLLKLFFGSGAVGYCRREHKGYQRLRDANLLTPECMGQGEQVLLYRWLADAQPVAETSTEQVDLTVDRVATLHRAGLLQTDMHLDNFLYCDDKVWLIDPDGIRQAPTAELASPAFRDNLAVLLAQLPPQQDMAIAARLMRYCHSADLAIDSAAAARLSAQLPAAVESARADRVSRYLNKTMRECTEFHARSEAGQRFVCRRDCMGDELMAFAQNPEAVFDAATVIKAGNTATVVRAQIDGHSRIVKRYNIKGLWHRLRQSLRSQSRAERSWRNGHRLRFLRIPTAVPIALLETRCSGLRDVAYLVSEDLGSLDLLRELQEGPLTERRLDQIAGLFEALRLAKLCHGDTKATNILVHDEALHWVDLDSLRESVAGFSRDRERFVQNWSAQSEVGRRVRERLGL